MPEFWGTHKLQEEAEKRGRSVSQEYIQRLCREGIIRAQKPARDWLIPEGEALRWLDRWLSEDTP